MKKNPFLLLPVLLSLLFVCYCHMANRPVALPPAETSAELPSDQIPPTAPSPALTLHAAGVCLMDASSGRILYGKNETTPLPMASTTKIMTCLLALEHGDLNSTVTFSPKAASMPKVRLGAGSGRSFVLNELLYSLMLESHNDTAVAIAEHIGGSVEGFAAVMNAKAAELGMTQTTFVTPNGLDADGHSSTPADMCRLAAYACQNESFLGIISTPSHTLRDVTGKHSYSLTNRDAFLTSYEGAIGIKTGFTGKAGYCFVGAAKRDDRTFVSCVLASGWPPNKSYKWADTKALMDYGFETFTRQNISIRDLSAHKIPVENGTSAQTGITQPAFPAFLLGTPDTVDIDYQLPAKLQAPIRKEVPVGTATVSINGIPAAVSQLYPLENIPEKQFADFIDEVLTLFFSF
ncbi:MAG: D-alanyl-D-alanine carboxypeptidase [Roseburia sp.]|nr:D-alanyl-D-alanine carboxypeptidase [Roseburia sp.]